MPEGKLSNYDGRREGQAMLENIFKKVIQDAVLPTQRPNENSPQEQLMLLQAQYESIQEGIKNARGDEEREQFESQLEDIQCMIAALRGPEASKTNTTSYKAKNPTDIGERLSQLQAQKIHILAAREVPSKTEDELKQYEGQLVQIEAETAELLKGVKIVYSSNPTEVEKRTSSPADFNDISASVPAPQRHSTLTQTQTSRCPNETETDESPELSQLELLRTAESALIDELNDAKGREAEQLNEDLSQVQSKIKQLQGKEEGSVDSARSLASVDANSQLSHINTNLHPEEKIPQIERLEDPEVENITTRLREEFYVRLQEDEIATEALALYIEPQIENRDSNKKFSASNVLSEFARDDQRHSLLILGDSGMGKTALSLYLADHCWQQYQEPRKGAMWIPIWLSIASIDDEHDRDKKILQTALRRDINTKDISLLKQKCQQGYCRFLVIIDSWDEVPYLKEDIFLSNGWWQDDGWPNLKVINTCRPEVLIHKDYRSIFQDRNKTLTAFNLLGMGEEKISYIKKFIDYKNKSPQISVGNATNSEEDDWHNWNTYHRYLRSIPGLSELTENPFILSITLSILPQIVEQLKLAPAEDKQRYTMLIILEHFDNYSRERAAKRLWNNKNMRTALSRVWRSPREAAEKDLKLESPSLCDSEEVFIRNIKELLLVYLQNLAALTLNLGQGRLDVNAVLRDEYTLHSSLVVSRSGVPYLRNVSTKKLRQQMKAVRSSCLLKTQSKEGDKFCFRHKLLIEFYAAKDMLAGIISAIDGYQNGLALDRVEKLFSINNYLLKDQGVLRQFAEEVQREISDPHSDKKLMRLLNQVIVYSAKEPRVTIASANAMRILHLAGFDFNGRNFRDVRISGVDLSGGIFDSTDFSGADLSNVCFIGAWVKNANFSNAYIPGVKFLELAPIKHNDQITAAVIDTTGKWLLTCDDSWRLTKWNLLTGNISWQAEIKRPFLLLSPKIIALKLAVNPDGRWLAVSCHNIIHLWQAEDGKYVKSLLVGEGKPVEIKSIVFCAGSPLGIELMVMYKLTMNVLANFLNFNREESNKTNVLEMLSLPDGESIARINDTGDKLAISPNGQWLAANKHDGGREIAICNLGKPNIAQDDAQVVDPGSLHFIKADNGIANTDTIEASLDSLRKILPIAHQVGEFKIRSCFIFSPDGKWFIVGAREQVTMYSTDTWQRTKTFSIEGNLIDISADSKLAVVASSKGLRVWHVDSGKHLYDITAPNYDPTSSLILVSAHENRSRLYQVAGENIHAWRLEQFEPGMRRNQLKNAIDFSQHDGEHVPCPDRAITTILVQDGLNVKVVINGAQSRLIIKRKDEPAYIHYFNTKGILDGMFTNFSYLLSPNKKYIVFSHLSKPGMPVNEAVKNSSLLRLTTKSVFSQYKMICIWDLMQAKLLHTVSHDRLISAMIFSNDGEWLITIGNTIRIWSMQSGKCIYRIKDDEHGIGAVAISPNNEFIATFGTKANVLCLWFVVKNRCIYALPDMYVKITHMAFSKDSTHLQCNVDTGGQLIFKLQNTNNHMRFVLVFSSANLGLVAHGAKVTDAIELSDDNYRLLQQKGAQGERAEQPSANALAKFGLMKFKDADGMDEKALYFENCIIANSAQSFFRPRLVIHYQRWVISLLRNTASSASEHAFIVIEGMNACGRHICIRCELTYLDENKQKLAGARVAVQEEKAKLIGPNKAIIMELFNKRIDKDALKGYSWSVSRAQALALRQAVKVDAAKGIRPFSQFGSQSVFSKDEANNCYTWARTHLLALDRPEITKQLENTVIDYLIAAPPLKFRSSPAEQDVVSLCPVM